MTLGRLSRPLLRVPIRDRLAPFSRTSPAPVGRISSPSAIPQTQRERFHDTTDTGPIHGPTGTAGVSPAPSARRSYPSSYPDSTGHDDRYHYDGLYQVTRREQGSLTLDQTAVCGVPAEAEAFAYDPTGNCRTASRYDLERGSASLNPPLSASAPFQWLGYRKDEAGATVLDQERKNNRDNQIVQFDGSSNGVAYDRAGNARLMPPDASGDWETSCFLTWDAWNRLVQVEERGSDYIDIRGQYAYDGLYRRITKTVGAGGTPMHSYYSDRWKVLEERAGTSADPARQYVWGARPGHRDELVLRDRDCPSPSANDLESGSADVSPLNAAGQSDGNGTLDERLYAQIDYYNGTSIVDASGAVQERYEYSAFGVRSVMAPGFSPRAASLFAWDFGFQGQFLDVEIGYLNYGYRHYNPMLGRWVNRNPIGEQGGYNIYKFSQNNNTNSLDYLGLTETTCNGTIVIGHYTGRDKNGIDDRFERNKKENERKFKLNPLKKESRTCYVGCGANELNAAAATGGWGIPNAPPKNNLPTTYPWGPSGRPLPHLDPKDYLPAGETLARYEQAKKSLTETPCKCCESIEIKVDCIGAFENNLR